MKANWSGKCNAVDSCVFVCVCFTARILCVGFIHTSFIGALMAFNIHFIARIEAEVAYSRKAGSRYARFPISEAAL